jgi:GNAT superfamily N-acetyltransferase
MAGPLLRKLGLADMDAAAAVHRSAFDQALPWLAGLHTPEEDRQFFRTHVFRACEVWGAAHGSRLVGIVAFREGWIDQLYVLPTVQRRGIGTALLDVARERFARLQLWSFQRNAQARRFYESKGFVLIEQTDGSGNEEKEPDARYLWSCDGPR